MERCGPYGMAAVLVPDARSNQTISYRWSRVEPVDDLLVTSILRLVELHRTVEVSANDPVGVVGDTRSAEQGPQDFREPKLGIVRQLDAGDICVGPLIPWNEKCWRVNGNDPESLSRTKSDSTSDDPSVAFRVDSVDPLRFQIQRCVDRPPGQLAPAGPRRWLRYAGSQWTLMASAGCGCDYGATLGAHYRYPEQMSF